MLEKYGGVESPELLQKKHNFVIIGFGDLGKGRHQLLTEAGNNVYVASLNGREYGNDEYREKHQVQVYNVFKLPISIDEIDVVLVCCTANDISMLYQCLPHQLLKEKGNKFVFFQNGIGIREQIKELFKYFGNNPHPTQVVPYFSFKTNGGSDVKIAIAKDSSATGDMELLRTLLEATNVGPHQNMMFEGVDSIVLRKIEREKGYINSFLNTICVVYQDRVKEALNAFNEEFGPGAQDEIYHELLKFNNETVGDELAHMELEEIKEDIENAITKFSSEYPSTYIQYYISSKGRDKIYSDEEFFVGKIMKICELQHKKLPLLSLLYDRMIGIKGSLNQKLMG